MYLSRVGRAAYRPPASVWPGVRKGLSPRSFQVYPRSYSDVSLPAITKVEKIILDNIKTTGPLSFASYMQLCLSHPTEGYYMKSSNAVFGSRGDFITSPEISQVFGELVGIWLLSQWLNAGESRKIRLVELGPGRGTLMDDILRVVNQFPVSRAALSSVHLVENSLSMQDIQKNKLLPASEKGVWDLVWHDALDDVPQGTDEYTMLVAHEFFDALPINVLERTQHGWHEVLISDTPNPVNPVTLKPIDGPTTPIIIDSPPPPPPPLPSRLRLVLSPSPTPTSTILGLSSPRYQSLPVGSRIEVSHSAFKAARKIGEVLGSGASKGSALVVDYGGNKAYGDSFRAFKNHEIVDVFHRPGECDLTANVDFAYLKEAFADIATAHGPLPQSEFLTRMGMNMRVESLKSAAKTEERKDDIEKAAKRLIDGTGMGKEYQVLGVTCHGENKDGETTLECLWPFVDTENGIE